MARHQGAETIDFSDGDPIETLKRLTGGIGPDRVIDAVGVDAEGPEENPELVDEVAPERVSGDGQWQPGNAPDQVAKWAVEAVAKAGTIGIPELVEMTRTELVEPAAVLTQLEEMVDVETAYKAFDRRESGWIKVELAPARLST
jgi:threonine dehydrogenase-like Zn-dependent dehydrogenase